MFQVQVFEAGADEVANVMYAPMHQGTLNFLQSQFDNINNISSQLTDASRAFFDNAKQMFEKVSSSAAIRASKAAINKLGSMFDRDIVVNIYSLAKMQNATPIMQRYIMANPEIRQMYFDQRIDGYSDTYVDLHPGKIGENHIDYQQVINGMVLDTDDGGWKATVFAGIYADDESPLDIVDQVSIMNTWDMVNMHIRRAEEDPTDPYRNML